MASQTQQKTTKVPKAPKQELSERKLSSPQEVSLWHSKIARELACIRAHAQALDAAPKGEPNREYRVAVFNCELASIVSVCCELVMKPAGIEIDLQRWSDIESSDTPCLRKSVFLDSVTVWVEHQSQFPNCHYKLAVLHARLQAICDCLGESPRLIATPPVAATSLSSCQ